MYFRYRMYWRWPRCEGVMANRTFFCLFLLLNEEKLTIVRNLSLSVWENNTFIPYLSNLFSVINNEMNWTVQFIKWVMTIISLKKIFLFNLVSLTLLWARWPIGWIEWWRHSNDKGNTRLYGGGVDGAGTVPMLYVVYSIRWLLLLCVFFFSSLPSAFWSPFFFVFLWVAVLGVLFQIFQNCFSFLIVIFVLQKFSKNYIY